MSERIINGQKVYYYANGEVDNRPRTTEGLIDLTAYAGELTSQKNKEISQDMLNFKIAQAALENIGFDKERAAQEKAYKGNQRRFVECSYVIESENGKTSKVDAILDTKLGFVFDKLGDTKKEKTGKKDFKDMLNKIREDGDTYIQYVVIRDVQEYKESLQLSEDFKEDSMILPIDNNWEIQLGGYHLPVCRPLQIVNLVKGQLDTYTSQITYNVYKESSDIAVGKKAYSVEGRSNIYELIQGKKLEEGFKIGFSLADGYKGDRTSKKNKFHNELNSVTFAVADIQKGNKRLNTVVDGTTVNAFIHNISTDKDTFIKACQDIERNYFNKIVSNIDAIQKKGIKDKKTANKVESLKKELQKYAPKQSDIFIDNLYENVAMVELQAMIGKIKSYSINELQHMIDTEQGMRAYVTSCKTELDAELKHQANMDLLYKDYDEIQNTLEKRALKINDAKRQDANYENIHNGEKTDEQFEKEKRKIIPIAKVTPATTLGRYTEAKMMAKANPKRMKIKKNKVDEVPK